LLVQTNYLLISKKELISKRLSILFQASKGKRKFLKALSFKDRSSTLRGCLVSLWLPFIGSREILKEI